MDESAHRVRSNQSQHPQDQKNHKNGPQHISAPSHSCPVGFFYPTNPLSTLFLVNLLDILDGIERAAISVHHLLSLLHNPFVTLAQLSHLLIQNVESLSASLVKVFSCLFARARRKQEAGDSA
jgi:hypothetical protein